MEKTDGGPAFPVSLPRRMRRRRALAYNVIAILNAPLWGFIIIKIARGLCS